ncbi:hypothetical protein [Microbacterium aerolatum]|uniref:Uncharacterized protein n=1 Tax=Microbacterium aerolatum TaxID=153731 RepID=A0A511AJP7_9MICO|nr:hypothetical protein [Microbacterium aerolatum]GEK87573.1 hypothetical protein MAE01_27490 [Microbacterium aerolatum]GGB14399.1 hypothetical protein GCM10007198_01150 [Microbacterium aerolatum]
MRRRTAWVVVAVAAAAVIVAVLVWLAVSTAQTGPPRAVDGMTAVEPATGPEATALAQQQLDARLAACTESAAEAPDSCGIAIPWTADFAAVDGIRYRVEKTPELTLTPPTFRADDGILVATVTGTGLDGTAKTLTYRTENWMLRGDLRVKRAGVGLVPW